MHHLTYERVGEEHLDDLVLLCVPCHSAVHELERRGEMGLDFAGLVNERRAEINRRRQVARKAKLDLDTEAEKVSQLDKLRQRPASERLALAIARADKQGADIRSDLRIILRRLDAIERKLL